MIKDCLYIAPSNAKLDSARMTLRLTDWELEITEIELSDFNVIVSPY